MLLVIFYGIIINVFEPHSDGDQYSQRLQGGGFGQQGSDTALEQATDRLVEALRETNKNMRVVRDHEAIRIDRDAAFSERVQRSWEFEERTTW
jgi:hypothetical protein